MHWRVLLRPIRYLSVDDHGLIDQEKAGVKGTFGEEGEERMPQFNRIDNNTQDETTCKEHQK